MAGRLTPGRRADSHKLWFVVVSIALEKFRKIVVATSGVTEAESMIKPWAKAMRDIGQLNSATYVYSGLRRFDERLTHVTGGDWAMPCNWQTSPQCSIVPSNSVPCELIKAFIDIEAKPLDTSKFPNPLIPGD